jgi:hypothetical protein
MKIVQMLRCDMPGDNYARELRLCDVEMLKRDVAPNAAFHLVVKFLRSTDFLYVPIAEGKVGGARGSAEDPIDHKVYNRNYEALGRLSAMPAAGRSSLSSQALSELRMYVGQFGQLPPEVLALTKKE